MKRLTMLFGLLLGTTAAYADYSTGFEASEGYSASASGVVLSGQQGWYLPAVSGSVDYLCYTYSGNVPGFSSNPNGGAQFIAGESLGGSALARAQHDHDYTTSDVWTVSYDFCPIFSEEGAAAPNLSSASLQPSSTAKIYIALNNWMVDADPTMGWKALYLAYDAAGTQFAQPGLGGGPEWENLTYNKWYRQSTTFSRSTNQILEIAIKDLTTGVTTTFQPTGWYLQGGSTGGSFTDPTAFRFFTGGAFGNHMAWDNLSIAPPAKTFLADSKVIIRGQDASGEYTDTHACDNVYDKTNRERTQSVTGVKILVQYTGHSPIMTGATKLTVHTQFKSSLGGAAYSLILMKKDTSGSTVISSGTVGTSEIEVTADAPGNPNVFIKDSDGEVSLRYDLTKTGFVPGVWTLDVDCLDFTVQ